MDVCGVDLETTGLDEEKSYITEIGAAIFDGKTWEKKAEFKTFVYDSRALPLSEEIKALTHIRDSDVRGGRSPQEALGLLESFSKGCGAFIAHNKEFEKKFLKKALHLYDYKAEHDYMSRPWICSKEDIEHTGKSCTKLSHLAVDYGCTVDGSSLHRAIADVDVMGQMLARIGKSAEEIIEYALQPWVYIQALVGFAQKDLAAKDGYGWQTCKGTYGPVFDKMWVKRVKADKWEAEKARQVDFKRVRIQTPGDTK